METLPTWHATTLGTFHLLSEGGDGSKIGGSTKNIEGTEGGLRKILHVERGVYENKFDETSSGVYKKK